MPKARSSQRKPRAPRLPRAEREQQMLEIAAQMFNKHGYEGTSMDDIASACGVTKPMLYAYFGSKEGLHSALIAQAGNYIVRAMAAIGAEKEPTERLYKASDIMIGFVDKYRDSWQMVFSGSSGRDGESADIYREQVLAVTVATFAKLRPAELSKERAKRIVEPYAHVFLGAAEAGAQWWLSTPGTSLDEVRSISRDFITRLIMMIRGKLAAAA